MRLINGNAAQWARGLRQLLIIICPLALAGCGDDIHLPQSKPAPSQAEAGTMLLSSISVEPWDDVSSSLKPNFALTGDQALQKVLPITETIGRQSLTGYGFSVAAGLPTTAVSSKTVVGGDSPGTVTTTDKEPGTAPTLTNSVSSSATLPGSGLPSTALGFDPRVQYQAANDLLTSVQLLNSAVDYAATRSCSIAYIVNLKLSVMNYRPGLPYSIHAHIGFSFNGNLPSYSQPASFGLLPPTGADDLAPECKSSAPLYPTVVPLLATEDLQAALNSRSAEVSAQLQLGLSALIGGAGVKADAGLVRQTLTAILNHDISSSLTVGRESEQSIYTLIAPNNEASGQPALPRQSFDVAVLLLVPRAYFGKAADPQKPTIAVASYTEYRDATTGEVLPDASSLALAEAADRAFLPDMPMESRKVWDRLTFEEKAVEARRLAQAVEFASPTLLENRLSCNDAVLGGTPPKLRYSKLCGADHKTPFAWGAIPPVLTTKIGSLLQYDREKITLFEPRFPAALSVPRQQVLLNDDGNHAIQVVLGGVSGRSVSRISARLRVTPFDTKSWASLAPIDVPAQGLSLDSGAHTLTLNFPSLKKLNVDCLAPDFVPPKPSAARAAKPAKPADKAGAEAAETPAPCPTRRGGAGTEASPNAILLALDTCDPSKQLCPTLTDTVVTERRAIELKLIGLQSLRALLDASLKHQQDIVSGASAGNVASAATLILELTLRRANLDKTIAAAKALDTEMAAEDADVTAANDASDATRQALNAALMVQRGKTTRARTALGDAAKAAQIDAYVNDYAMLGVSFAPAAKTVTPPKVAFSNFSQSITFDPATGQGRLDIAIAPSTTTDTVAVTITGAGFGSITDQAKAAATLDSKHRVILPSGGSYSFVLTGLNDGVPVTLIAQALDAKGANDGDPLPQIFLPHAGRASQSPATVSTGN